MRTHVVNITRGAVYDVYIGRAGKGQDGYFGNPYVRRNAGHPPRDPHLFRAISITRETELPPITLLLPPETPRTELIAKYRAYFIARVRQDPEFAACVEGLRGKALGCFCAPLPCHGDVIIEYLEHPERFTP